MIYHGMQIT